MLFPNPLYQELVLASPDAILYSDRAGLIRLWNPGAERLFGFSPDEALGASLDLIIPENLRKRHWDGYYQVMESGVTGYGTKLLAVPALHRSGQKLSVEFSIALHRDATGQPSGVSAIVRDVTERFAREQQLRKELAQSRSEVR